MRCFGRRMPVGNLPHPEAARFKYSIPFGRILSGAQSQGGAVSVFHTAAKQKGLQLELAGR